MASNFFEPHHATNGVTPSKSPYPGSFYGAKPRGPGLSERNLRKGWKLQVSVHWLVAQPLFTTKHILWWYIRHWWFNGDLMGFLLGFIGDLMEIAITAT